MFRLMNEDGILVVPWITCGSRRESEVPIYPQLVYGVKIDQVCTLVRRGFTLLIKRRAEWQLVDLAVQAYAKVSVCLYETLGLHSAGKVFILSFTIQFT